MEVAKLNIEYENDTVKEYFDDLNLVKGSQNLMLRKIGLELTKSVKKRYNQLLSFTTFAALQTAKLDHMESLKGDLKNSYSIHLTKNYRLIFKPKSKDIKPESLNKCDTTIIKGVIDYHDAKNKHDWLIS